MYGNSRHDSPISSAEGAAGNHSQDFPATAPHSWAQTQQPAQPGGGIPTPTPVTYRLARNDSVDGEHILQHVAGQASFTTTAAPPPPPPAPGFQMFPDFQMAQPSGACPVLHGCIP